jgi:hypothetical protein
MSQLLMALLTGEGRGRSLASRSGHPVAVLLRVLLVSMVVWAWLHAAMILVG